MAKSSGGGGRTRVRGGFKVGDIVDQRGSENIFRSVVVGNGPLGTVNVRLVKDGEGGRWFQVEPKRLVKVTK